MPVMRVNHQRTDTLSGLFVRVTVDARRLTFRFLLDDTARARAVVARIRGGQIRGVSIGFRSEESRYVGKVLEHRRAHLFEISLCDQRTPAWYDTFVAEER